MRRQTLYALFTVTAILMGHAAQAGGGEIVFENDDVRVDVVIHPKLPPADTEFTQDQGGHYVFVASARPEDVIQTSAMEQATICTGIRPYFGMTQPTAGGFNFQAYAAYYGPYASREEAVTFRETVAVCVSDAYVRSGLIQRF